MAYQSLAVVSYCLSFVSINIFVYKVKMIAEEFLTCSLGLELNTDTETEENMDENEEESAESSKEAAEEEAKVGDLH